MKTLIRMLVFLLGMPLWIAWMVLFSIVWAAGCPVVVILWAYGENQFDSWWGIGSWIIFRPIVKSWPFQKKETK